MANDVIDIVVSQQAFNQVAQLDEGLQRAYQSFLNLYNLTQQAGNNPFLGGNNGQNNPRQQINELERAVRNLQRQNEKLSVSENNIVRQLIQRREEVRRVNQQTKQEGIINSELSNTYERMSARLNLLRRNYKAVAAEQGINSREARRLRRQVVALDTSLKQIDASAGQFGRTVGNYPTAFRGATRALRNLVGAFGFAGGIYLFVSAMKDAFNRVREFDKAMQNISGIMRVSRKDVADLEREIKKVAGTSIKTSNEVAKLAENLVTLGKTKEEIKDLLKPVNDLAIGLETTSGEAAEFLVQMLNTFQASTDEASKYADVIATIRTSTSLDFQRMRDSFQYLAPISKVLNKDLAYTGALIGILADNGIKAERAGRLLGTAQQKLASENKSLNDALKEINTSIEKGSSELETLALASDLLGKQSASLGVVLAQNTEIIDRNADAIRNNSGALEDLTNEQLESLDAKLKILDSTWERFILGIENGDGKISQFFKKAIEGATNLIESFEHLNKTQADHNADNFDSGKDDGKTIIETIQNSTMSDSNKKILIEEYRLDATKKLNAEFVKQKRIKNDILVYERKIAEYEAKVKEDFFGSSPFDAFQVDKFNWSLSESNEELEKSNRILSKQKGILKVITDLQLKQLPQEENNSIVPDKVDDKKEIDLKKVKDYSLALQKARLEDVIDTNEHIIQDDELTLDLRLKALAQFEERSIELAQLIRDAEIKAAQGSAEGKELAQLKYERMLDNIYSERLKKLDSWVVDANDVMSELGVEENIQSPSFDDSIAAFANFFGFDPELMLKAWEDYVQRMEQVGKDATLNGFFDELKTNTATANEQLKELAHQSAGELINFTNAVFDNKTQRIDEDIQRENDRYSQILDNETLTEQQRQAIEAERDAKVAKLERKKREEQRKQAIFNKIVSAAEIGINTAQAVTKNTAQLGLLPAIPVNALTIALGAAQLATVMATPIPRYKYGKNFNDNYEGIALVNDGGRDEVKLSSDGTVTRYSGRNVLDYVKSDDVIFPSVNDFEKNYNQMLLSNDIRPNVVISNANNEKAIEKAIEKGFKKANNKIVINMPERDLDNYINSKMHS